MVEKYGFVYIWFDRHSKRYYIGSHWGFEDDGYICSSNWMRRAYYRRPEAFKRRIIKRIYTNRKDLYVEEQRYLDMIKHEELRVRYYNLRCVTGHWTAEENALSIREKISLKVKGENHPNYGKNLSEETKQKIRDAANKQWANNEFKQLMIEKNTGQNNPMYGREISDTQKQQISHRHKGKLVSKETRQKLSEANRGKTLSDGHKEKLSAARKKRDASKRKDALWVPLPNAFEAQEFGNVEIRNINGYDEIKFIDLYKSVGNGVSYKTAWRRLNDGWNPMEAVGES